MFVVVSTGCAGFVPMVVTARDCPVVIFRSVLPRVLLRYRRVFVAGAGFGTYGPRGGNGFVRGGLGFPWGGAHGQFFGYGVICGFRGLFGRLPGLSRLCRVVNYGYHFDMLWSVIQVLVF